MRRSCLFAALFVLAQIGFARHADAWWKSDWSHRMRIVMDTTAKGANISAATGRTHILVRLHGGNFDFTSAKDDGSDIRFVAGDDRTPLHFDVEKYDGLVDQVALLWVDVSDIPANAQTPIYVYWGNKNANGGQDPHATYGSDQVLVYHFADDAGPAKDSTGYGNTALNPVRRDHSGLVGNGALLDGQTPVALPKSSSLALAANQVATWSGWVRLGNGAVRTAVLFSQVDNDNQFVFGLDNGVLYAQLTTAGGVQRTSPGKPVADGWHLLSVTSGDHLLVRVDGVAQGNVAAALPAMGGAAAIGGMATAAASAPVAPGAATPPQAAPPAATALPGFSGGIDEFEIRKSAVPAAAELAAVASAGTNPTLLTFDVAEQSSFFGTGYVGIIVRSVSADTWVVIGILGIMALVSWWVMIGKAMFVARSAGANARFRREYRALLISGGGATATTGLVVFPDAARRKLRDSPLARLHDIAADEVLVRLNGGRMEQGGALAPESIPAIQAAMDTGLVREATRLNRLMVLLTIAIAGGPFLGLFGTVVGVMITFAAIAQAGDVNVNAIAPGISAALLATVAGLFVAIPALFGYNYLLTRIRDVSNDMQSFVNELVTRMGEGRHAARLNQMASPGREI